MLWLPLIVMAFCFVPATPVMRSERVDGLGNLFASTSALTVPTSL
ncbi:MAG: hypothetical protein ABI846_04040 [Rudaea sp.]